MQVSPSLLLFERKFYPINHFPYKGRNFPCIQTEHFPVYGQNISLHTGRTFPCVRAKLFPLGRERLGLVREKCLGVRPKKHTISAIAIKKSPKGKFLTGILSYK